MYHISEFLEGCSASWINARRSMSALFVCKFVFPSMALLVAVIVVVVTVTVAAGSNPALDILISR